MKKILWLAVICVGSYTTPTVLPAAPLAQASDSSSGAQVANPSKKRLVKRSKLANCTASSCTQNINVSDSGCSIDLQPQDVIVVNRHPKNFVIKMVLKNPGKCNFGCTKNGAQIAGIDFPPVQNVNTPWAARPNGAHEYDVYLKQDLTTYGIYKFTIQLGNSSGCTAAIDPVIANG